MLDEKTIEELHSYYDRLPGGICLVKADDSEEILLANAELLNYYQCANWQEFKELTGGKLCLLPVPVQDERRPFQ